MWKEGVVVEVKNKPFFLDPGYLGTSSIYNFLALYISEAI